MAIASKSLIMSKHFMQRYLRFLIDLFENKRTAGQKVSTGMHTKSHLQTVLLDGFTNILFKHDLSVF